MFIWKKKICSVVVFVDRDKFKLNGVKYKQNVFYSVHAPNKVVVFSTIICAVLCNKSDSQLWCHFGEILFPILNRHISFGKEPISSLSGEIWSFCGGIQ